MKILIIVPSYKPAYVYGGPIRVVADLCESLVKAGQSVTVFCTSANGKIELNLVPGKKYDVNGVNVYYFSRIIKGHTNYSPQLLKSIRNEYRQFDIIHIHSWWNFIAIASAFFLSRRGVKPIITPHGSVSPYTFNSGRKWLKRFIHYTIGKKLLECSYIHSATEKEDKEIGFYVRNQDRYIISNLLDLPKEIYGIHSDANLLRIIFVGRIHPVKNLETIFRALAGITFPYAFYIIGDGEEKYVQELRARTMENRFIQWKGPLDGEEKFNLLAQSDLLVLPSFTENFGNVVFEALSQGTAVLVSEYVGSKDYVITNDLGWVSENSVDHWKAKLELVNSSKEKRQSIRLKAPGCIERDFKSQKLAAEYISMYQECLSVDI